MYRKIPKGWIKHIDFMLLDLLCLWLANVLAVFLHTGQMRWPDFGGMCGVLSVLYVLVALFIENYKNILKRGYLQEMKAVLTEVLYVVLTYTFYLFVVKQGDASSRGELIWTVLLLIVFVYTGRILWKKLIAARRGYGVGKRSMVLVSTSGRVKSVLERFHKYDFSGVRITGLALVDEDRVGEYICGIPVVADQDDVADYVLREWVDEVFVTKETKLPNELIDDFEKMGVTIHMEIQTQDNMRGYRQFVERMGGYTVLSSSVNVVSGRSLVCKRIMDICAGVAGCIITGILFIFIAPAIYIKSPGPIFFAQTRIGRNGKPFKMYKFRSMYLDAEERKAELMAQNDVKDGMMFKLENDPRIIGSENGRGIGNFIRSTSLDEFPQFWNVLKGEMSLVGTRPPTVDEWQKYAYHHRARLAIKPGITGMWQVSGRSEVKDFEQVVKLDLEYIENWSFLLDIKILLKTVQVVFKKEGAR